MPEGARVLRFRQREAATFSSEEALETAKAYLSKYDGEGHDASESTIIRQPEVGIALLSLLTQAIEVSPARVGEVAERLYSLLQSVDNVGLFDEKDYLLGEFARFAGWANRLTGNYETAERWLDRAEAAYRHTVNPGPLLANANYTRLAIRYETHRYADVLDLIPSLISVFEKLGMSTEAARSRFLQAVSLRASGQTDAAFSAYCDLSESLHSSPDRVLLGQVLVEMGEYCGTRGEFDRALVYYSQALPVVREGGRPIALAQLKWSIGATYRAQGKLTVALDAYREAREGYKRVGLSVFTALVGLSIADTLLTLERPREAEWEILAALPVIEESRLSPEVEAAAALLRESAHQRKTNPQTLNEFRELISKHA